MLPSLLETSPLVWMAEVNGFLVDLRDMPREVQEIALEKGMVPFVPTGRRGGSTQQADRPHDHRRRQVLANAVLTNGIRANRHRLERSGTDPRDRTIGIGVWGAGSCQPRHVGRNRPREGSAANGPAGG